MTRQTVKTLKIPYLKEEATQITYENGYTFIFVPKRGDVFNISTWVRTGSIHENDENSGISHFLEHLMFKGTKRFKPGEFDRAMESLGNVINAATWKDFTFYYVSGPKGSGGKNFNITLDMHADMMTCSTLPNEEIGPQYDPFDPNYQGDKRERSVVIEEIGMREDQPWTKVYNSLNKMMYPEGHPYRRDVIGTRQIIGSIPRETILNYHQKWYSPQNFITIVVGDFKLDELEAKVLDAFKFEQKPQAKALTKGPPITEGKTYFDTIKGDYTTNFFIMGYHGPSSLSFEETIALDVISHSLGEGRSSRLTQALVEKPEHPLFNFISCGQSAFKLGNVFFIQGNFIAGLPDPKMAIAQVEAEIEKLLDKEPLTEAEFQRAIKSLKSSFAETSETASGIADAIGESITVVDDLDYYLTYLDVLANLKLGTVQAVAKKYLTREKAYTTLLVPEAAKQKLEKSTQLT